MKTLAKKELQSKTIDELIKELRDARSEVAKLMIEMTTGKVKNINSIRDRKKDIARMLTYLSQKKEIATSAESYSPLRQPASPSLGGRVSEASEPKEGISK